MNKYKNYKVNYLKRINHLIDDFEDFVIDQNIINILNIRAIYELY